LHLRCATPKQPAIKPAGACAENNQRILVGEPFEVPAGAVKPLDVTADR
jgi:hypothetical protein